MSSGAAAQQCRHPPRCEDASAGHPPRGPRYLQRAPSRMLPARAPCHGASGPNDRRARADACRHRAATPADLGPASQQLAEPHLPSAACARHRVRKHPGLRPGLGDCDDHRGGDRHHRRNHRSRRHHHHHPRSLSDPWSNAANLRSQQWAGGHRIHQPLQLRWHLRVLVAACVFAFVTATPRASDPLRPLRADRCAAWRRPDELGAAGDQSRCPLHQLRTRTCRADLRQRPR